MQQPFQNNFCTEFPHSQADQCRVQSQRNEVLGGA